MTVWRWAVGPWNVGAQRQLTLATARKLTFCLTAPCTATFTLPGRSDEASQVVNTLSDLWVYADSNLVYRGRVVQMADTVDATAHTTVVTCTDYRGLLAWRLLVEGDQLVWNPATYADVAWGLVGLTQAKTDGGLSVVQGPWTKDPATNPTKTYSAGQVIGQAIDDLAKAGPFDWWIDPTLTMQLFSPSYRPASGFVADYGGTVVGFQRSTDTSNYANGIRESGEASQTTAVNLYTAGSGFGRFEQQIGNTAIVNQAALAAQAATDQQRWLGRRVGLNMDLRSGIVNSPADLALGSQILVSLADGSVADHGTYTVAQLTVTLSDEGVTHTSIGTLLA